MKLTVTVNGVEYDVEVEVQEPPTPSVDHIIIGAGSGAAPVALAAPAAGTGGAEGIAAPLAGTVFKILCEIGQEVKECDVIVILEAMKMETEIFADKDGVVEAIHVEVAEAVQAGQALVLIN